MSSYMDSPNSDLQLGLMDTVGIARDMAIIVSSDSTKYTDSLFFLVIYIVCDIKSVKMFYNLYKGESVHVNHS